MKSVRQPQRRHLFATVFHPDVVYDVASFELRHLGIHFLSNIKYLSCQEIILIIHNSCISFIHNIVHQYTTRKLTVASVLFLNIFFVHYVCIVTALNVRG